MQNLRIVEDFFLKSSFDAVLPLESHLFLRLFFGGRRASKLSRSIL